LLVGGFGVGRGYLTNFQILLSPSCKGEGTVELELGIFQALPKDLKLLRFRYGLSHWRIRCFAVGSGFINQSKKRSEMGSPII
jgi:hypothetical protein